MKLTLYVSDKCGSDQYVCGDYSCISETMVCDGLQDCPRGEEEKQCCKKDLSVCWSVTVNYSFSKLLLIFVIYR